MMEQSKTGAGSPMGVRDFLRAVRSIEALIDDPEAVAQALQIQAELDRVITDAVYRLRTSDHFSYTEIAAATGLTRQGARARWPEPAGSRARFPSETETEARPGRRGPRIARPSRLSSCCGVPLTENGDCPNGGPRTADLECPS